MGLDPNTAEGLVAVRKRPEMYFGPRENRLAECVAEAMCIPLAQAACGGLPCDLHVESDQRWFLVSADGPPLPMAPHDRFEVPFLEVAMTRLFACRDAKSMIEGHHDLCRAGLAAVNALSLRAEVEVRSAGTAHQQRYTRSTPDGPFHTPPTEAPDGITIAFEMDPRFIDSHLDRDYVQTRVKRSDVPATVTWASLNA